MLIQNVSIFIYLFGFTTYLTHIKNLQKIDSTNIVSRIIMAANKMTLLYFRLCLKLNLNH